MRWLLSILLFLSYAAFSQSIGGETVFSFINLSNTPQLTALGGINISNRSNDVGMAFHNPSLLVPDMHAQLNLVYNSFFAGIRNYSVQAAYYKKNWQTTFSGGINYFNYGQVMETDASGNVLGNFRPTDFVLQIGGARAYTTNIYYGATVKFIHSDYGRYTSSGFALDASVLYADSNRLLQGSLLLKNMGFQSKAFEGSTPGDLPFDIQLGVSKKLENAPFQFSLTAHHLHHFDIRYNDTLFDQESGTNSDKSFFFDKLFRHFVLACQISLADHVEISLGYNHLRRKELNIGNGGNGLNGFSLGTGVLFRKLQLRYAKAWFRNQRGYHQIGLSADLK
ncbi:MAG TPA: type IX secretion system protein PorQ [Flavitalea sp.]|nr:type IX secretion system protein PorQ [Flavitalea sp.]